jgi:hypothetical protein
MVRLVSVMLPVLDQRENVDKIYTPQMNVGLCQQSQSLHFGKSNLKTARLLLIALPGLTRIRMMRHMALKLKWLMGCMVSVAAFASAAVAETVERGGKDSIAVFVGQATDTNFVNSMYAPWTNELKDIGVVGVAYNHRFGSFNDVFGDVLPPAFGDHLLLEGEVGGSFRFGDEKLGEGWAGLFLRYDGFFWNDTIYTTIAVNTGVSLLTEHSGFERGRDSNRESAPMLHYMGPEITFADPENKDLELLIRYHHRSGVFGLFDGVVSGSTFISTGVRYRF